MSKSSTAVIDATVASLKKSRFTWIGQRKTDKEGEYYTSVLIEKSDGAFVLNVGDTIQMESPDDEHPFVGVVLRLYEANAKKMLDVEWFFTKEDVADIAPKNHKNAPIEGKEVFLAEGEVEIVDNMLGLAKQPCYIVYLTPQESKIPENKRAMAKAAQYYPLYFCRYKLNQQQRMVSNIGPEWTTNDFIRQKWSTIPEDIRHFLQHETSLACFKQPPRVDPNATTAALVATARIKAGLAGPTGSTGGGSVTGAVTSMKSETTGTASFKAESTKESAASTAVMLSQSKRRASAPAPLPSTLTAFSRSSREPASSRASAVSSTVTLSAEQKAALAAEDAAAHALTKEQVLSMDVYDLAQRVMFDELEFSSSDNQSSSSDEGKVRRSMPGVVRTKGRSSLQKRIQYRHDRTFILHKWSDLGEKTLKSYFLKARALKEQAAAGTLHSAASTGNSVAQSSQPSSQPAAQPLCQPPRPAQRKSTGSLPAPVRAAVRSAAAKDVTSTAQSAASARPLPSDDDASDDDFADIKQEEFSALVEVLKLPGISDGDLSYKLFCYEEDQYASSSTDTDSESSGDGAGNAGGRRGSRGVAGAVARKPKVRTVEQLAEKVRKREERRYRAWTDLSFKRMKSFTLRARRLREYYEHLFSTGALDDAVGAAAAGAESGGSDGDEATLPQGEEVSESIKQAVRAGLGKYEIALKLLAADLAKELESSSDDEGVFARGRATRRGSASSALNEMSRVVDKFNAIPPRQQSAYMKRAAELQTLCGVGADGSAAGTAGAGAGAGANGRRQRAGSVGTASTVKQEGSQRTRKPSVDVSIQSRSESRKRSVPSSGSDSSEETKQQTQRRRRGADYQLMARGLESAPVTRKSTSSRARYEEVRLKREVADHKARGGASKRVRLRTARRITGTDQRAQGGFSSGSSSDSGSESGDEAEEEVGTEEQPAKLHWREMKKLKEQARRDSYKQRTEKLKATIERKKESQTAPAAAAAAPAAAAAAAAKASPSLASSLAQLVHVLIPPFALSAGPAAASDSEDADVEEVDEEEEVLGQRESQRPQRRRGMPEKLRSPAREAEQRLRSNRGATETTTAGATGRKRGAAQPSPQPAPRRGYSGRRAPQPSAGRDSDIEEYSGGDAPASKRRRVTARSGKSDDRSSNASDLVSVDSRDSASEGENSLSDGEEEEIRTPQPLQGYGTRGRARQNSLTQPDFLHKSPTARGREERIGSDYQAEIPAFLGAVNPAAGASTGAAGGTRSSSRVDTSRAVWIPQPAKNVNEGLWKETRLATYLTRANDLVDQLKADMLRGYFEGRASRATAAASENSDGKVPVDPADNTFVLLSGEARTVIYQTFLESNYDADTALAALRTRLTPFLVLWTSAEQHSLGTAFDKFGMTAKALFAAVPGKSNADAWEYVLRFLSAAEELEENTTYSNADGVECIIPAIRSSAYQEGGAGGAGAGAGAGGGVGSVASSSSNLAGHESDSAKFIERLSASVDETSFWQFLLSLSSVVKSGEFSPSQMVVKAHYILSCAKYNVALSYAHRAAMAAVTAAAAAAAAEDMVAASALSVEAAEGSTEAPTTTTAADDLPTTGTEPVESADNEGDGSRESPEPNPAAPASTEPSQPAVRVPTPASRGSVTKAAPRVTGYYTSKDEAIRGFNMFLPVLVSQ